MSVHHLQNYGGFYIMKSSKRKTQTPVQNNNNDERFILLSLENDGLVVDDVADFPIFPTKPNQVVVTEDELQQLNQSVIKDPKYLLDEEIPF